MRNPDPSPPRRRRARWTVLAFLVAATVAGRHLVDARTAVAPTPPSPSGTIDAFTFGDGLVDVRGHLDRTTVLAGGEGAVKLELLLSGVEGPASTRPAETDFVVVLDRSGSMDGEKLVRAREATLELLGRLGPRDRFALVTYSSDVRLDIPLAPADPDRVRVWRRRVEAIAAGGGTNLSAGLDRALEIVAGPRRGPRRVVLLSDGLANEGDATLEGLTARARRVLAREAVLTTVGIGLDFDERLMTRLADRGAGNFYFLERATRLAGLFDAELGATRETVASAVELRLDAAPGVRLVDAAGYPVERAGRRWSFRPGPLFAGQERRLWLTLEVPTGLGEQSIGRFALSYVRDDEHRALVAEPELTILAVADPTTALEGIDRDRWARSVVEEEAGALRQAVATYVQEGRREQALEAIRSYRKEKTELNRTLRSAEVAANLEEVAAFEDEVGEAFTGADQAAKQNVLSKRNQAVGWDQRRAGSKKAPTGGGR